jgi:hypothetical protein
MKTLLIGLLLVLMGCSNKPKSREDFFKKRGVEYIKVGNTELTARLMNTPHGQAVSDYSNTAYLYFDVTISRLSGEKFGKEKAMYLDFDIEKDFVAASGKDSLAPAFCQKIENGKGDSYEYIVAFAKTSNISTSGLTLMYEDKIFGVGKVAFVYEPGDLKNKEPKS